MKPPTIDYNVSDAECDSGILFSVNLLKGEPGFVPQMTLIRNGQRIDFFSTAVFAHKEEAEACILEIVDAMNQAPRNKIICNPIESEMPPKIQEALKGEE